MAPSSNEPERYTAPSGSMLMPFKKAYCVTSVGCLIITTAASVALLIVGIRGNNTTVIIAGIVVALVLVTLILWYISLYRKRKREAEEAEQAARRAQNRFTRRDGSESSRMDGAAYSADMFQTHDMCYNVHADYLAGQNNAGYVMDAAPVSPPPYAGVPPPSYEDVMKETNYDPSQTLTEVTTVR